MVFELVKESEIAIKRNRGKRRKREKERDFRVVEQRRKNVKCYE